MKEFVLAALALLVALAALPMSAQTETTPVDSQPAGQAAPSATTAAPHVSSKTTIAPPGLARPKRMRTSRHFSTRIRGKTRITRFYNVVVKDRPRKDNPKEHGITVRAGGATILVYDNHAGDYADVRAFQNYPRRGMATLFVRTYSGGAHCCNTYFLLTRHRGGKVVLSQVELGHGWGFYEADGGLAYPAEIMDTRFAYYGAGGSTEPMFSFCFAGSPKCTRYLVHGAKGWRVDRIGEFPKKYRRLMARAEKEYERILAVPHRTNDEQFKKWLEINELFAFQMEKAYYALMAGEPATLVRKDFERHVPEAYVCLVEGVVEDVREKVESFNPTEDRPY